MTRKSNGARYEYSRMSTAELNAQIDALNAQIVPGKPKELSAETRKANGALRRKVTNACIVLSDRRMDEASSRAAAQMKAEGVDADTAEGYQAWHARRFEIAGQLVAEVDY